METIQCKQYKLSCTAGNINPPQQLINVKIVEVAVIQAQYPSLEMVTDPKDLTRLRFIVLLQNKDGEPNRMRLLQWNDLLIERWRTMSKELCAELCQEWDLSLTYALRNLSPPEVEEAFQLGQCRPPLRPEDVDAVRRYALEHTPQ